MGCSARSDTAIHGKTSQLHTEECRQRSGEQVEDYPEGHVLLQVHERRRDAKPEVEVDQASVAIENEGGPAPLERQDVEMPVEAVCVCECGSNAVADNEERARLRLRAEGKRGQKHDVQDVLEFQAKTNARLEPRSGQKRESTQTLPDQEERSRIQFLLRVALLRFREARAPVRMLLSILLWVRA